MNLYTQIHKQIVLTVLIFVGGTESWRDQSGENNPGVLTGVVP